MANYFSLILVIVTAVSGLIWLLDALVLAPKRKAKAASAPSSEGGAATLGVVEPKEPYIVDTAKQIFPVIAFVLVLRSFLYEPFQIPSGSMMPTLLVGDFILVEKFAYGLKDPVARHKFVEMGQPERGDIVVFKYPEDTRIDYIKRVVGLPGDVIEYRNKQVFVKPACVSGETCVDPYAIPLTFVNRGEFVQNMAQLERYTEEMGDATHDILRHPVREAHPSQFFTQPGTRMNQWIVPEDSYFVLGDNRDNSRDSRFWGFVKDEHLVGKAVAIWISFEFERDKDDILPTWVPTGIRFSRFGGID
ncbi:signal peptidase I [Alteromonas oceanisediminis]|uniref:signal peptidase I n=1 Tax=Alteromonas oceanisediminis TaxID=2836180 RepID=UPI001BD9EBAC|nr:signal peptidase I [Alteromonas oceanisediminis]MBT0585800.1 signal peptidase I [Alteromonas oceanisediminis]